MAVGVCAAGVAVVNVQSVEHPEACRQHFMGGQVHAASCMPAPLARIRRAFRALLQKLVGCLQRAMCIFIRELLPCCHMEPPAASPMRAPRMELAQAVAAPC